MFTNNVFMTVLGANSGGFFVWADEESVVLVGHAHTTTDHACSTYTFQVNNKMLAR